MTKQTKLELVQINARLAAENAALRTQVLDLQLDLESTNAAHAKTSELLCEELNAIQRPTQRVARHMPQWQVDRGVAMAAARAAAMEMRCTVKVGA